MSEYKLHRGDCIEVMRGMADNSVDSVVCDPPYGLEFMGKDWDGSDGFRRSLNKADAGRDNAFGRTSRTSPEYRAGHLFQEWCEVWATEALRVLKPGGHMLAFSGSRTYHRMVCAIEDAGFEVRDQIMWVYGSGFPKSMNVSKSIDKASGADREVVGYDASKARPNKKGFAKVAVGSATEAGNAGHKDNGATITAPATAEAKQWEGWGTALKPAHEPICVARKPLAKGMTVAANVLAHGTGAINIDACRVEADGGRPLRVLDAKGTNNNTYAGRMDGGSLSGGSKAVGNTDLGRWPANIIIDGSAEVVALFPAQAGQQAALKTRNSDKTRNAFGAFAGTEDANFAPHDERGSAARFFYCAKASRKDRNEGTDALPQKVGGMVSNTSGQHMTRRDEGYETKPQGNSHPTVKPTDLMAYLCRLVTPPGGLVLDPFMGSGSTGKAAVREGFRFVGIDLDADYLAIATARIEYERARIAQTEEERMRATAQPDLFSDSHLHAISGSIEEPINGKATT